MLIPFSPNFFFSKKKIEIILKNKEYIYKRSGYPVDQTKKQDT